MTDTVAVVDEQGRTLQRAVPKSEYRRSFSLYFFDNRTGDPSKDWIAAAIPVLLEMDLGQDPFLTIRSPFDGPAVEFCRHLEEIGVVDQDAPRREIVIDPRYELAGGPEKSMVIEPAEGFSVSYLLRYPPPIGEQRYEFVMRDFAAFCDEIAPSSADYYLIK